MGADIRAFVVAGKVVAAMQRTAAVGDFRSNLHRGGVAKAIALRRHEREVALASANALGLTMAGVDLVRTREGPVVLEVNASPGFEGLEKATRAAVAESIVRHVEGMARAHRRAR
jgi:ribosomal protein S6--L-glutamate ligase